MAAVQACAEASFAAPRVPDVVSVPLPLPVVEVARSAAPAPSFAYIVRIADRPHLVLAQDPSDGWIDTARRGKLDPDGGIARAAVSLDRLPPDLADASTQPWVFHTEDGRRCVGGLGAPSIVAQGWFEFADPELGPEAVLWQSGRKLLVAPLDASLACDQGTRHEHIRWARLASSSEPTIHRQFPAPARARAQATAAFLATEPIRDLAEQRGEAEEPWASRPLADDLSARVWASGVGPVLFELSLNGEDFGGCGALPPTLGLVAGAHDPFIRYESEVAAIFDLDADGSVEVLLDEPSGGQTLLRMDTAGSWSVVDELPSIPFDGCGC